ncbi:uncharacterized protein LOC127871461 [Dreissena polymorpha]|uniref:Uncharacterized protein n=1 Tax=Dreissena polymorpha TaxID=45954 RepID=A0A9D4MH27_DREPO|nr:uncharacterized protein LOC127871461 [Dreissena polymorpha]KAH3877447.1 hypothetical protein DPMN_001314 [Dreissena polymorpha]
MKRISLCGLIAVSVFVAVVVDSRHTEAGSKTENVIPDSIDIKVLRKREAINEIQKDYPYVNGRTFRASAPLSPTARVKAEIPQSLASFEPVNTIMQPEIDNIEEGGAKDGVIERRLDGRKSDKTAALGGGFVPGDDGDDEEDEAEDGDSDHDQEGTTQYGAQLPYVHTTSEEVGRNTDESGQTVSVTRRRVVLTANGTGSDPSRSGYGMDGRYPGYSTGDRSYGSYYPSEARTTSDSRTAGVVSGNTRNTGGGYDSTGSRYTGSRYPTSRPEERGAYYSGPRYIDSNGHYVDAQGRHLDSTGRYYDTSGRYQDAHTNQRVTQVSGGEEESERREYGTKQGYQYVGNGRYVPTGSSPTRYTSGSGYQTGTRTSEVEVDRSQSRPVNSYGGTQFYSGGANYRTTYDPIVSQISSDPNCPVTGTRVTINGLSCHSAISQLGRYVCYNYERVSGDCCERCLQVKRPDKAGCEYGDRSDQCRDIQAFDCYNDRNRQICCERCEHFRSQIPQQLSTCQFGDLTPRCQEIREKPYLCYLPDNQRICCSTCPRLANRERSDCQWGDQSPELCQPFDANRRLKINCYLSHVREICCSTCPSLQARLPEAVAGCEYGDSPVLFNTGRGVFGCSEYIRNYGFSECDNPELSRECCYTCYRYRKHRGLN